MLRSKSPSQVSTIRIADSWVVSGMDGQRARLAKYFELCTADPPCGQLPVGGLLVTNADSTTKFHLLLPWSERLIKLGNGKALGICKICAELLKAGVEAMIHGMYAVLTAVWQSRTIPADWKRDLVFAI